MRLGVRGGAQPRSNQARGLYRSLQEPLRVIGDGEKKKKEKKEKKQGGRETSQFGDFEWSLSGDFGGDVVSAPARLGPAPAELKQEKIKEEEEGVKGGAALER